MVERTTRGEEDREQEDHEMTGEPVDTTKAGAGGATAGTATRDKGVEPAKDDPNRAGHRQDTT